MKVLNVVGPIVVVIVVAVIAIYLASARASDLERDLNTLRDDLDQTRDELAGARKELAAADTSELREELEELSRVLWEKIQQLDRENAGLKAQVEKLASAPPARRGLAGEPGGAEELDEADIEEGVGKLIQGALRRFGQHRIERRMDRFKDELDLTDSQVEELGKVMSEQAQKSMERFRKAFEGGEGADPGALREELTKELDEALRQVLTPEQFDKFKEMEKNRPQRWGGSRGSRRRRSRRPGDGGSEPAPRPGGGRER